MIPHVLKKTKQDFSWWLLSVVVLWLQPRAKLPYKLPLFSKIYTYINLFSPSVGLLPELNGLRYMSEKVQRFHCFSRHFIRFPAIKSAAGSSYSKIKIKNTTQRNCCCPLVFVLKVFSRVAWLYNLIGCLFFCVPIFSVVFFMRGKHTQLFSMDRYSCSPSFFHSCLRVLLQCTKELQPRLRHFLSLKCPRAHVLLV